VLEIYTINHGLYATELKMFDTKLFIKKIQNYPEIFDTTNAGFKQIDGKNGAWDKLADEFKVDCKFRRIFKKIA
jgi:hypothetical protein